MWIMANTTVIWLHSFIESYLTRVRAEICVSRIMNET